MCAPPLMTLPHYRPRQKPLPRRTVSSQCLLYSRLSSPFDNSLALEKGIFQADQKIARHITVGARGFCFGAYFSALKAGKLCDYWRWDMSHARPWVLGACSAPSPRRAEISGPPRLKGRAGAWRDEGHWLSVSVLEETGG